MHRTKIFGLALFFSLLAAGCGGPTLCECDQEAEKENPDPALLKQCKDLLAGMEFDELIKAQEECGKGK